MCNSGVVLLGLDEKFLSLENMATVIQVGDQDKS